MASKAGVRYRARWDVVDLASYIGRDNNSAAYRFLQATEATFELLAKSPRLGAIFPVRNKRLHSLRVFRVQDFSNHLVFYLEREYGVEIVRVLHGARDLDAALEDE